MEIIKVYEAETLFQSVATRVEQYKELKGQLNQLKNEFTNLVNNDQFLGNGATAIKGFYQAQIDVVDEWSSFIEQNIAFFEGIKGMAEGKELAGETVVKMPFLEENLAQSTKRAYQIVDQQKADLQTIFDGISDLISLKVFSSETFETYMDDAESKRTQAIQKVNKLDGDLLSEYVVTEEAQIYIFTLYSQLIEATRQGENISPLYFNAKAYKTSEIYQLKDDMDKKGNAYLTFKKKQREEREIQKEIDAQANKPWYEKTWDATKTFTGEITGYYDYKRATEGVDPVTGRKLSTAERIAAGAMAAAGFIPVVGWAGRALKGGKAIYSTAKGINAASHALDAYKTTKSLSILEMSEKGIYGLVAANGMSEAVTGKDMFGNQLTEEQRRNSLLTALGIGGVAGAAKVVDKVGTKIPYSKEYVQTQVKHAKVILNDMGKKGYDTIKNVGKAGESTAKAIAKEISKVEVPTGIKVKQLNASNGTRSVHTSIYKTQIKDIAQKIVAKNRDSSVGSVTKGTGKSESTLDTKLENYVRYSFEGTGKEVQDSFNKYLRENVWCDETLSNLEKIEIMKENFNRLTSEQKIDFNVLNDEKFLSHNSDYTNWGDWPPINWPEFPGLDKTQSIISISKEYPIPEKLDRIGSLYGNNFAMIPENGIKHTMDERAICYIDNPVAYHKYTFNSTHYIDCIDCIKNKDVDGLNKIIDEMNFKNIDSHIEHIDENDMIDWNLQYNKFQNNTLLKALCEEKGLDSTYGLLGKAAPWYDEGKNKLLANGGAGQLNTPVSGNVLKYLGILREE